MSFCPKCGGVHGCTIYPETPATGIETASAVDGIIRDVDARNAARREAWVRWMEATKIHSGRFCASECDAALAEYDKRIAEGKL